MNAPSSVPAPIRVFLFKRPFVDAFHLRLAIGMSSMWCDVQVLERSDQGVRAACAISRARPEVPSFVLLEEEEGDDGESFPRRIRGSDLGALPLAVLGDGRDPEAERHALQVGADGFVPLPTRASELERTGRDIARFWAVHRADSPRGPRSAA